MPPASTNAYDLPDPNPRVFIEGELYKSSTFPMDNSDDNLPFIDDTDQTQLEELLRKFSIPCAHDPRDYFWPERLLRHVLSRERIRLQLQAYDDILNPEVYLNIIRPEDSKISSTSQQTYLKIFAMLLFYERGDEIPNFINNGVSDQSLPLCKNHTSSSRQIDLCHRDTPNRPLKCSQLTRWKTHEKDGFETTQWRLLAPYFELDKGGNAMHYDLHEKAILPWSPKSVPKGRSHAFVQESVQSGGFGSVSIIKINPCSHGFSDVLSKLHLDDELFALKLLHDQAFNDKEKFKHELEQLRRFNGLTNPHLVTLLATFTHAQKYYFIFPRANGSLESYWEDIVPNPRMDLPTVRWIAKQLSGIMSAVHIIHEPEHLHLTSTVRRYGRHGDIKPDNILWFSTSNDERGILVVSDMGLSALHSNDSRSGIARYSIPKVPGYQPPECDIKGGKISRAYDIWTLGCLFLELVTWLMGGWDLVEEFHRKRKAVHITGAINNIFFTLKTIKGQEGYVAQVKTEVTEWILELNRDEKCPQFVHDALEIIEKEMLVVLSQDRKRSFAKELSTKFAGLYSRCMSDPDYCTKGRPVTRPLRRATAVKADLTDEAIESIRDRQPEMAEHDPINDTIIREPMLESELQTME